MEKAVIAQRVDNRPVCIQSEKSYTYSPMLRRAFNMDTACERFLKESVTPVRVTRPRFSLSLNDPLFFIGSCFAEHMHSFLSRFMLESAWSPFGNTYNPLSLAAGLNMLSEGTQICEEDVFEYKGLWRHFAFHTLVAFPDKEMAVKTLNGLISSSRAELLRSKCLVITLGTAYAYIWKRTGQIVNNCHTLPGTEFERKRLSVDEIVEALAYSIESLRKRNVELNIVLTVSPVRYLRDGMSENSLSKAILRCAAEELSKTLSAWYFPSYEIMIDELRDYRYYADDLCHPSERSIEYITRKFIDSVMAQEVGEYISDMEEILLRTRHRPRRPDSPDHLSFAEETSRKLSAVKRKYPSLAKLQNFTLPLNTPENHRPKHPEA